MLIYSCRLHDELNCQELGFCFSYSCWPTDYIYCFLDHLMGVFHWGQSVANCIFGESGPMFTWSVRVGCSFPACQGGSVKFQTCFIFLLLLMTLVSNPNFIRLATGLSDNLTSCRLHFDGLSINQTGLSVTSIWLVPNMDFPTVRDDKQTVWEVLQYSR